MSSEQHISSLCIKASNQLNAIGGIPKCMGFKEKEALLNSFETKQIHHQLLNALDVALETQAPVHTCILTYNKVIISCRSAAHDDFVYVETHVRTGACVANCTSSASYS